MTNEMRRGTRLGLWIGAWALFALTGCEYDDRGKRSNILAESAEAYLANGAALESAESDLDRALQMIGLESEVSVDARLMDLERTYHVVSDAVRRGVGGAELAAAQGEAKAALTTLDRHVAILTQPYGDHRLPEGMDDVATALDKLESALGRAQSLMK